MEKKQEVVSNKFCMSLIDLYHNLAQKPTYNTSTVQVTEALIKQTGNTTITQNEITKRLTDHAKELKKAQSSNTQIQSSITSMSQASSSQAQSGKQTAVTVTIPLNNSQIVQSQHNNANNRNSLPRTTSSNN